MKNLKLTSKELANDINNNISWIEQELSFVIEGSYDSLELNRIILDTYKQEAINRGKRGSNLIAKIGIFFISKAYNSNSNQAISIYKYLTTSEQTILNQLVIDLLDDYITSREED